MALNTAFSSFAVHRCSKDMLGQVKVGRHSANRFRRARVEAERPRIPAPTLFSGLTDGDELDGIPNPAQCAVHLEFLQVLITLEQRVINSNALDRTFDLRPEIRQRYNYTKRRNESVRDRSLDKTFQQRRRVKWEFFVSAATTRFIYWWRHVAATGKVRIDNDTLPPLGAFTCLVSMAFGLLSRYIDDLAFVPPQPWNVRTVLPY
jgi:hypothetical protein